MFRTPGSRAKQRAISFVGPNNFTAAQQAQLRSNMGIQCPPQGRLTLQTAAPVMTTTQSAKTTIYYTPYVGSMVSIYDGINMVPTAFAEISVATTDTTKNSTAIGASKVNDWFVWNDSGTVRLSHGPDWTSDVARSAGTALVTVNGINLNSVSITNGPAASRGTYVGTTRSNGSSQLDYIFGASASGGTGGFLGVWNAYNRVTTISTASDTGVSYTYTSGTIRQARASAGNQTAFVMGLAEDGITATYGARVSVVAALNAFAAFGLNIDSTSAYQGQAALLLSVASNSGTLSAATDQYFAAQLGFHTISANESGDGTNANSFDVGTVNSMSVMVRN